MAQQKANGATEFGVAAPGGPEAGRRAGRARSSGTPARRRNRHRTDGVAREAVSAPLVAPSTDRDAYRVSPSPSTPRPGCHRPYDGVALPTRLSDATSQAPTHRPGTPSPPPRYSIS